MDIMVAHSNAVCENQSSTLNNNNNNNNSYINNKELSSRELELLAKLEEANRYKNKFCFVFSCPFTPTQFCSFYFNFIVKIFHFLKLHIQLAIT